MTDKMAIQRLQVELSEHSFLSPRKLLCSHPQPQDIPVFIPPASHDPKAPSCPWCPGRDTMTEQYPAAPAFQQHLYPCPSYRELYCRYIGTTINVSVNYRTYRSTEERWRRKSPRVMGKETIVLGLLKGLQSSP